MGRREPIPIGSENALDIAWAIYRTICDRKLRLRPVPYIRLFAVGGRPVVSDWSGGRHIDNLPAGTRRTRQRVDERNQDLTPTDCAWLSQKAQLRELFTAESRT